MTRKNNTSAISFVYVYLLLLSVCHNWIYAQDFTCCFHVKGSCRSVCEKISLVHIATNTTLSNQTINEIKRYCSPDVTPFWECLNALFEDISRGESWPGRVCCPLPHSESCRRACITATSHLDLAQGCRQSDEIAFFSCLEKQQEGETCCSNAKTEECKTACWDIFRNQLTPNKHQRQRVKEVCELSSPKVNDCVKEFVKVTPAKDLQTHMHCCDMSNNSKCRDACKKVLATKTTLQEMIDGLQLGGCGSILPQDTLWQCFMKPAAHQGSAIERVGIDSAKWHCCQHASSQQCQTLCSKTYTKFFATSWEEFENKCLNDLSEENLRSCLNEVEEPCELGCDGLSFCTNFNNRPTDLFRSCSVEADEAARNEVATWQTQNELTLPHITLPLKNITKCSPNVWKAVACTLQIQPCSRDSHANQICRDVCIDILSQCIDWLKVPLEHSAETICASLSPEDHTTPCVDLTKFLNPSENNFQRIMAQVSSPCKGDPCKDNEVCLVNRDCIHGVNCLPYKCIPGCKLGEASEYMVPDGTYVRIPITNKKDNKSHLKICKCKRNRIEDCQPLLAITLTSCLLGNTYRLHGSTFNMDCNTCSCFAGEVICTIKQCESTALAGRNTAYTTLPCNCPLHYVPVCGRNGVTYSSACLAKCAGLTDSDIEYAPCQDPCSGNSCPIGYKCVPDPQVCLSLHRPCKQNQCISGNSATNCDILPPDPICDIDNKEYANPCWLINHNAKFAYKGPCLRNCKHKGAVCGINGKTYISECAAHADLVSVDYQGACKAVGLVIERKSEQCSYIKCTPLPTENCMGVTPPGACCPVCGGALRLLYSRKQIDRALYALNQTVSPLSLQTMLRALQKQIQVAQCVLRGYLTMELDIFVVVQSTETHPSKLQMEACVREAEKIGNLIKNQNPRIVSELSLSSLTTASIVHNQENVGSKIRESTGFLLLIAMVISFCSNNV